MLTAIGGGNDATFRLGLSAFGGYSCTNKLYSLVNKGDIGMWAEVFPPMPTKRRGTVAVCTGTHLIVAGGEGEDRVHLTTIEVMNIDHACQ